MVLEIGLPLVMQNPTLSRDDRECQLIGRVHGIGLSVGQLAEHKSPQLSHSCRSEKPMVQILA